MLREVPGTALAADQAFRLSDFAIDYCEDVPPLPPETPGRHLPRAPSEEGVQFKVSSIHVNFWLGSFDKMTGVRRFVEEQGIEWRRRAGQAAFSSAIRRTTSRCSRASAHTIAVGNLRRFLDRLSSLPEYITEAESAAGVPGGRVSNHRGRRALQ